MIYFYLFTGAVFDVTLLKSLVIENQGLQFGIIIQIDAISFSLESTIINAPFSSFGSDQKNQVALANTVIGTTLSVHYIPLINSPLLRTETSIINKIESQEDYNWIIIYSN